MRKRYKIVLNVEVTDAEKPYPAGGDYMHLNQIEGTVHRLLNLFWGNFATVTLDKVIDKGEVKEGNERA